MKDVTMVTAAEVDRLSQLTKKAIHVLIIIFGATFILSGVLNVIAVLISMFDPEFREKFGYGIGLLMICVCGSIIIAGILMVKAKELPKNVPLHVIFLRLLFKLAGWYAYYLGTLLFVCCVLVLPKIGPAIMALVMGSGMIWVGRRLVNVPKKIWAQYEQVA